LTRGAEEVPSEPFDQATVIGESSRSCEREAREPLERQRALVEPSELSRPAKSQGRGHGGELSIALLQAPFTKLFLLTAVLVAHIATVEENGGSSHTVEYVA
jgi:hypothetical protein